MKAKKEVSNHFHQKKTLCGIKPFVLLLFFKFYAQISMSLFISAVVYICKNTFYITNLILGVVCLNMFKPVWISKLVDLYKVGLK